MRSATTMETSSDKKAWGVGAKARLSQPANGTGLNLSLAHDIDWLVVGRILPFNPASSVRGPKHVVKKGKTPVLSAFQLPTVDTVIV